MREYPKRVIGAIFSIILISLSYTIISAKDEVPILFWGDGCPHCVEVKKEIKESRILQDIEIEYLEIYNNQENADLFQEKIGECGFSPYQAGVPMLYSDGTCWMGKYEVIDGLEAFITGESNRIQPEQESDEEVLEGSEKGDLTIVETKGYESSEYGSNTVMYILIVGLILMSIIFVVILSTKRIREKQK